MKEKYNCPQCGSYGVIQTLMAQDIWNKAECKKCLHTGTVSDWRNIHNIKKQLEGVQSAFKDEQKAYREVESKLTDRDKLVGEVKNGFKNIKIMIDLKLTNEEVLKNIDVMCDKLLTKLPEGKD